MAGADLGRGFDSNGGHVVHSRFGPSRDGE
jgi:hypothetical protein